MYFYLHYKLMSQKLTFLNDSSLLFSINVLLIFCDFIFYLKVGFLWMYLCKLQNMYVVTITDIISGN